MISLKYYDGEGGISIRDGYFKAWFGRKKSEYEYEFYLIDDALIFILKEHFYRSMKEN
jgi:hypothetical protein